MIPDNQLEQARNTDMVEFLAKTYGYHFRSVGGGFRPKEHPSLHINSDKKRWFWHSSDVGGCNAIDFLMKIERYSFVGAVETILNCSFLPAPTLHLTTPTPPPKKLQLPPKAQNHQKLWWYLCEVRKLDPSIVRNLENNRLIYQDTRGNVVFVGINNENIPKFASLRGTIPDKPFRKDCFGSDKGYGFHMTYEKSPRTLFVFESPIDCISHGSLVNLANNDPCLYFSNARLSLGGVSSKALEGYLERFTGVKEIVFCLDNDDVGRKISFELANSFALKGYWTEVYRPKAKDYNLELIDYLKK